MTEPACTKAIGKSRKPGFLLEPLGWVQHRLSKAIEGEPRLVELLFHLDTARMHLVGLALAHLTTDVSPDLALILLQGSRKMILNLSLGQRPVGIDRVLHHLPPKVLPADTYRNLVDLLNDPVPAKVLHHAGLITEPTITGLHSLPLGLRTAAIIGMFNRIEGMTRFADGLRILAARAGLPLELVAQEIVALDQSDQVIAKVKQIVDSLPPLATLLPVKVGGFRRLDTVAEIRNLAKTWNNCLADHLSNVNDGTSAIYLSEDLEAVCSVGRFGRMGWFLQQTKGPKNVDIDPGRLAQIHAAFATAGIPPSSMIDAIKAIVTTDEWSRPYQPPNDDEILENIAVN
jgi:hypothetical protein